MAFFGDVIGKNLNRVFIKALVLAIFAFYLVISLYGVTQVREGLERKKLARFDSYSVDFYALEDNFFREYPYRINVSNSNKLQTLKHNFMNSTILRW